MKRVMMASVAGLLCGVASPAFAWGDIGHKVTALIAYKHLTPSARAKLDTLLASDPDTLTAPDFASRATWADKYREGHRETAQWHFVDIEVAHPDLNQACFGFPGLPGGAVASAGPADDCVIDKIDEFSAELADPATSAAERLFALKFLIHFVGDLHQPLHASDHEDHGGNCVALDDGSGQRRNLHGYWDTGAVLGLGHTPEEIAASLEARITPSEVSAWSAGSARDWAEESYKLAVSVTYQLPSLPTCTDHAPPQRLTAAYEAQAKDLVALQLEKAGIRMAYLLNRALS